MVLLWPEALNSHLTVMDPDDRQGLIARSAVQQKKTVFVRTWSPVEPFRLASHLSSSHSPSATSYDLYSISLQSHLLLCKQPPSSHCLQAMEGLSLVAGHEIEREWNTRRPIQGSWLQSWEWHGCHPKDGPASKRDLVLLKRCSPWGLLDGVPGLVQKKHYEKWVEGQVVGAPICQSRRFDAWRARNPMNGAVESMGPSLAKSTVSGWSFSWLLFD